MRILILIMIFLGWNINSIAQAKISFENTTVDYAEIEAGSDGNRVYKFKNIGDKPLIIKDVVSTSHLLEAYKPDKSIDPGQTGEIKICYDTKKKGPVRRTVTVYSNAENQPVIALKVKGNVK